ncbi:MAG: 2-oxoglutarate dehydrogenase subunit E1 [marine bacterium B5-7]|nr:MAG: 2-oxoglutarate dehydrogenase subunit E1 [marine bacterium B5-7]
MSASEDLLAQQASSYLGGPNAAYVEQLYEDYLQDPQSVDAHWRANFDALPTALGPDLSHAAVRDRFAQLAKQPKQAAAPIAVAGNIEKERQQGRVSQLINAYRSHGHHHASLDPLGLHQRLDLPALSLSHHQLTQVSPSETFSTNEFSGMDSATVAELDDALKSTYAGSIGLEFRHITNSEETTWLQQQMESQRGRRAFSAEQQRHILHKLTAAEGLEKDLATRYVGQKRFSLEGGDSLIPLLDELIQRAGQHGVKETVLGMAHRGRLNVLLNVMGKAPRQLFEEFAANPPAEDESGADQSGDVKYHLGFSSDVTTPGGRMHLSLAFNPSHLEIISPVVEGSVRARQDRRGDKAREQVLPVLIHGDAAFAGQGVVMETFSLSQARGFRTGGSIHIIINNQIGFTTSNPIDARSTLYCTDVAKMVQAPVLHVNGDDPEAVIFATQMAIDYRMKFQKDVVLDLVCYRRHGHNEADEPSATQPLMYQTIRKRSTLRTLYGEELIQKGIITKPEFSEMMKNYRAELEVGDPVIELLPPLSDDRGAERWAPFHQQSWLQDTKTALSMDVAAALATQLTTLPTDFTPQPQVKKVMGDRAKMAAGELPMDWGFAENLAYASLLQEGYPVRLVGQDAARGTFAHRHAVLHDYKDGHMVKPLKQFTQDKVTFTVIDSLLSEEAVMAFEYGYASTEPNTLTIWEAQFGDFANGAQVVVDQFLSSGEQKWGRLCGLILLLPHGYEGMGPEHSSARLERYLQLCAQQNMQVCVPTTPAQAFHMLRRQMLRSFRTPLIVMSPKSLLRHRSAVSTMKDITDGEFQCVIPEIDTLPAKEIKRVVVCSGKVYYDLLAARRDQTLNDVAIIRVEQLYPFPVKALSDALAVYPDAQDVVWCQEEPKNQGPWHRVQHWLKSSLQPTQLLYYAGRKAAASTAAGFAKQHAKEQAQLVQQALSESFV